MLTAPDLLSVDRNLLMAKHCKYEMKYYLLQVITEGEGEQIYTIFIYCHSQAAKDLEGYLKYQEMCLHT